jgi:hypothetical protein
MAESLDPIERLPDTPQNDRVNPTDRSNPEKKDNGFSNALKEKMKERLKKKALDKDEVILEDYDEHRHQSDTENAEAGHETPEEAVEETDAGDESDDDTLEHVDLKA